MKRAVRKPRSDLVWLWAEKGEHRLIFARLLVDDRKANGPLGLELRRRFLVEFPGLLRQAGVD